MEQTTSGSEASRSTEPLTSPASVTWFVRTPTDTILCHRRTRVVTWTDGFKFENLDLVGWKCFEVRRCHRHNASDCCVLDTYCLLTRPCDQRFLAGVSGMCSTTRDNMPMLESEGRMSKGVHAPVLTLEHKPGYQGGQGKVFSAQKSASCCHVLFAVAP